MRSIQLTVSASVMTAAFSIVAALSGCDDRAATAPATAAARQTSADTIDQEKVEASLRAAQQYIDNQDFVKSQAILVTLIERAPREIRAREMYGQSLLLAAAKTSGRASEDLRHEAYEQYKAAVEIEPGSAGLHHSAGQIALASGNTEAAMQHFSRAESLDPSNPQYPLYAAQLLIQSGDFAAATARLQKVLALDADEPYAHASLAIIALEQQQAETARSLIARAREIRPDELAFRVQQAKVYRRTGDSQRALELLVGLNADDRAQEMVTFEIAAGYEALRQPLKSAAAWQHMFQRNPRGSRAWYAATKTGEHFLKAGEREHALQWLEQAQLAAPDAAEVIALERAIRQSHVTDH